MAVTVSYDGVLSRILIDANALGAATRCVVERSTDQTRWTTVRGGGNMTVIAGVMTPQLSDYEFVAAVTNYYRVRGLSDPISYVAAGAATSAANGTLTPPLPPGLTAGDLVLVLASSRTIAATATAPAGYTTLGTSSNMSLFGKLYAPEFTDGFESGVTGWSVASGTVAQSSAQAFAGTKSCLLTATGSPATCTARKTTGVTVTPGQAYLLRLWVRSTPGWTNVGIAIDWYTAGGAFISSSTLAGTALAAATWAVREITAIAPATAARADVGPTLGGTPTGQALFFDAVEFASSPLCAFAGDVVNETTLAQTAAFRRAAATVNPFTTSGETAQNILHPSGPVDSAEQAVIVAGWRQDDFTSVAVVPGLTEIGEVSSTAGNDAGMVWDYQIRSPASVPAGYFIVTGGISAITRGLTVVLEHEADLNSQTASISPPPANCGQARTWLKSITRPFLNMIVQVVNTSEVSLVQPARSGVFPVVGANVPVSVNDVRLSRKWTMLVRTASSTEEENLRLLLTYGGVLHVHVPGDCSVPAGYVIVGDVAHANHPLRPDNKLWTLPLTEVAVPGPDVVGAHGTWQTVLNTYPTWSALIADKATWADVLNIVGDPSEVITG